MCLKTGLFVALVFATGTAALSAQGRGKGKQAPSNGTEVNVQSYNAKTDVSVSIGSNDQRVIREWFSNPSNLNGLPPGLAKRESLPPGLQRQLVRNGQLPPGLQKKIQPLPPALEVVLAPLPEGRKRVFISGSVVLLDSRKNLILDVVAAF
jgi:hypothetical protein